MYTIFLQYLMVHILFQANPNPPIFQIFSGGGQEGPLEVIPQHVVDQTQIVGEKVEVKALDHLRHGHEVALCEKGPGK